MNKKGTLYGVGVGPGDPELLTLKAVRILNACSVIAVPQTGAEKTLAYSIAAGAVDFSGKEVVALPLPMTRDKAAMQARYDEHARLIASFLERGVDVAVLNLGDVSLYSSFNHIKKRLCSEYSVKMIPGITSFCASAAALGIALTEAAGPVHIIPAGDTPLEPVLSYPGTKVFLKSGSALKTLCRTLCKSGLASKAALVQNCGLQNETICRHLEHDDINETYLTTLIVKE